MEYVLKNTTVYEDGSVVNVHSPILTPEEREQREKRLYNAAAQFARSMKTEEIIRDNTTSDRYMSVSGNDNKGFYI